MSKITEYIQSLEGLDLRQTEIDTLIEIIESIELENAELRARLDKAIELPTIERHFNGTNVRYEVIFRDEHNCITVECYGANKLPQAKSRLAELKGEQQ